MRRALLAVIAASSRPPAGGPRRHEPAAGPRSGEGAHDRRRRQARAGRQPRHRAPAVADRRRRLGAHRAQPRAQARGTDRHPPRSLRGEGAAELLGVAVGDGEGPDRHRRRAQGDGDLRLGEPVRPALGGVRRDHVRRSQRPLPLRALPARAAHPFAPDGLAGPAAGEHQDQPVPARRHHRQRDLGRRRQRDRLRRGPVRAHHRQRDRAGQRLVRLREGRLGVRARRPQPDPPVRHRRLHRRTGHRAAVHDRALHPLRGLRHRRPRQHDLRHRGRRDRRQRRLQRRRRPQPPVERRAALALARGRLRLALLRRAAGRRGP